MWLKYYYWICYYINIECNSINMDSKWLNINLYMFCMICNISTLLLTEVILIALN